MNRRKTLIILVVFIFLLSSACAFTDWILTWHTGEGPLIIASGGDYSEGESQDQDPEVEGATPTPKPTATPEPTPEPNPDDTLEVLLGYSGFTDEQKKQIWLAYWEDPEADWIYSIAELILTNSMDETDLRLLVGIILSLDEFAVENFFGNTLFPCGAEIPGGFVICTEESLPVPEGNVLLIAFQVAAPVPEANPDHFYTYSVVFDGDGNPDNNFQYNPPYDWDYYQNTDRWYMLDWNPDLGTWALIVSDLAQQIYLAPSGARAVVMGDIVAFFIPAGEFEAQYPGYRITAFGHDGSFSEESSSGDVSGANPVEGLRKLPTEIIVVGR